MRFEELPLAGAFRIELDRLGDARGFFARTFCEDEFKTHGLATTWAQCNMSFSAQQGTVRGLHFQRPPFAEAKLVRCVRGAVMDVVVDLRVGSSTYGDCCCEEISDHDRSMMYVPAGCAHGFQTLTPSVEMIYFHSAPYDRAHEGGVNWSDPSVAVPWPLEVTEVSERDSALPMLDILEPIDL